MLVYANLISELEHSLQLIRKGNILPLKYAYNLTYSKESGEYTLAVNKPFLRSHWKVELFLLSFSTFLGCCRVHFEQQAPSDRFTTTYFSGFSLFLVFTGIFQKHEAVNFAEFLTQLGAFERRHGIHKLRCNTSKLVVAACKQLSSSLFSQAIFYSLSCALFPKVAWNIIPTGIYRMFPNYQNGNSQQLVMTMDVVRRILIFLYLYVTNRVLTNFATINVVIHLLISTFSLNTSLQVVSR